MEAQGDTEPPQCRAPSALQEPVLPPCSPSEEGKWGSSVCVAPTLTAQ